MSETIGRVDFIAGLDGRNLPREARALGERMGREGGKGFDKEFDRELGDTFSRRVSEHGAKFANRMAAQGRLAGSRFSTDFEGQVAAQFRRMQSNLANILSDRDAFKDFALGFDNVDQAVERLNADLEVLKDQQYKVEDATGKVTKKNVLAWTEMRNFQEQARKMGDELKVVVEESDRLAKAEQELVDRHRLLTHRIGDTESFRSYAKQLGTNTAAHIELRREVDELAERMKLSGTDHDLLAERLDRTAKAAHKQSMSVYDLSERWKGLSHNTRQWTLIISAVAAGMQDLAVLGSAAGAGLFALGGGLTAGVAGLGGFVAAFSVLNKEVGDLPEHMRGVVVQFDEFKGSAAGVRDVIASSAFREMPNSFAKLSDTTEALYPAFSRLGTVVGQTFDGLADGLKQGTPGFKELNRLVENSANDFPALAQATGRWGTALMRALNEANPLTDQLLGYIGKLGDRFDAFTRSDSFGHWVRNSMQTWKEFGELLDATGRMLNDLVTPESVVRTQQFLDNLTEFMPNLGKMLDVLGRLDVFGLIAEALNDVGVALEPLYPAASRLADSFNDIGTVAIDVLAAGLSVVAAIATPAAEALADLLDAVDPGVILTAAAALGLLATSTKIMSAASVVAGTVAKSAAAQILGFSGAAAGAQAATGKWATSLQGIAGKAGLIGGVALAVGLAIPALKNWGDAINGYADNAREAASANLSLEDAVKKVVSGNEMYTNAFTDARGALEQLVAVQKGGDFNRWVGDLGQANRESHALSIGLGNLDKVLSDLPVQDASAKFAGYAMSVNASEEEVMAMLEEMPQLSAALEASAAATGEVASKQDIARMAMDNARTAAMSQDEAIDALTGAYGLSGAEVDILSAKLSAFAEQHLTTRSAARDFEASIDDLTASLTENGNTLDIGTEAGRRNEAAIDALVGRTQAYADELLAQTGNSKASNDVIAKGREELIKQLAAFDITGAEAEAYADQLGLIPSDIATRVALENADAVEARMRELSRNRTAYIKVVQQGGGYDIGNKEVRPYATGGTVFGPTNALIGEAGPEAVVPLNRPLSQVDPSVRLLSAIAQGKIPHMAAGGIGGAQSKTVIFEAGAIVVQGADDPRRAALEVADEVAERVGS